jgi:GxxExxY protein
MEPSDEKIVHKDLSYKIIGLAMQVHRELGFGFLEKVYENAMMVLFRRAAIKAVQQAPIAIHFRGEAVGNYFADTLVDDKIILEFKSIDRIAGPHRAQALNYLKATGMRLAIILNFGKESFKYERLTY